LGQIKLYKSLIFRITYKKGVVIVDMKTKSEKSGGKAHSRTKKEWELKPELPDSHLVSTELFTSEKIFKEED
jgi:hypothetical protein